MTCIKQLRAEGKPYPRTCPECGLGPCKHEPYTPPLDPCVVAYAKGRDEALDEAAAYVEGKDGLIPGANAFAALVSGNRQPCMSGDGRDRMHPTTRRLFDEATADLAAAIRALKDKPAKEIENG